MFKTLIHKIVGTKNERELKRLQPQVDAINGFEVQLQGLGDDDLRAKTAVFKERVAAALNGDLAVALEEILPEAFAVCRETARRVLAMRHFDVQLIGGMVLHEGKIAEMATGEGKTLAAVAPVFLHALAGRGAHVLTFNDYLAGRDAAWMGPVYERLGLTVGAVHERMGPAERRAAYAADVTYLTAKEAGFDHLRDGLCLEPDARVQRAFHYALVDEADSILIDEARIPLVIAGDSGLALAGPERLAGLVRTLARGVDFDTDEFAHNIGLTEAELEKAQRSICTFALKELILQNAAENIAQPKRFDITKIHLNQW